MNVYEETNKINTIAEKLELPYNTVHWIYSSVSALTSLKSPNAEEAVHVSAEEICEGLIRDVRLNFEPPFNEVLERIGIPESENVGAVISEIESHGLINAHESDRDEDFNNIYSADNIEEYMRDKKIKPKVHNIQDIYEKLRWSLYAVGLTLLIGSAIGIVHETAGKIAPIAIAAYFMNYKRVNPPRRFQ